MSRSMQPHKRKVTRRLDGSNLSVVAQELEVLERSLGVSLLARPFEFGRPGEVAEPVADEVYAVLISLCVQHFGACGKGDSPASPA